MAHQPIEELLPKSGFSVYRLVRMAAIRALELADGKPPLIKKTSSDKLTSIALEEIYQGKLEFAEEADGKSGTPADDKSSSEKSEA
ncbi:MAG: DNA-directed RNA polymerase subunit omega [Candidatus Omnitrophica bacterium]|nr:DNA-directed RNA polymerase subunit omega [Candidatus Omnitrophota bacterium]